MAQLKPRPFKTVPSSSLSREEIVESPMAWRVGMVVGCCAAAASVSGSRRGGALHYERCGSALARPARDSFCNIADARADLKNSKRWHAISRGYLEEKTDRALRDGPPKLTPISGLNVPTLSTMRPSRRWGTRLVGGALE
jgi:hypothetical protein